MPLAQDDDDLDYVPPPTIEVVEVAQPNIVKSTIQSPIVDTRYTPLSSLMQYVEGSSWTADYWSQVLTNSTETNGQAPSSGNIYQQYVNIKNLVLRVTTPLNYTQDQTTNDPVLTGEANVYPMGVIPNEGDTFTADVGDGRLGVFTISNVDRLSMMRESGFLITYTYTGYADDSRALLDDLIAKTVKTLYFDATLLGHYNNPLLTEAQVVTLDNLKNYYRDLIGTYFGQFYNYEHQCFIEPGSDVYKYDSFLNKFIMALLDVDEHPLLHKIRMYNTDEPGAINNTTIWDILINNQSEMLPMASKEMWLVGTSMFSKWPYLKTIYHSGLDHVVYPLGRNPNRYTVDNTVGLDSYVRTITVPTDYDPLDVSAEPVADVNGSLVLPPIIHSVTSHTHYVLSNAFYDRHPAGQSQLELMTRKYLDRTVIDWQFIKRVYDDSVNWTPLNRYYQLPVLLLLIKQTIRRFR